MKFGIGSFWKFNNSNWGLINVFRIENTDCHLFLLRKFCSIGYFLFLISMCNNLYFISVFWRHQKFCRFVVWFINFIISDIKYINLLKVFLFLFLFIFFVLFVVLLFFFSIHFIFTLNLSINFYVLCITVAINVVFYKE